MTKSVASGSELPASLSLCPVHGDSCPFADEVVRLRQEVQALNTMVRVDELTGLYNYRHFLQSMDLEMERSRRSGHPVSLILLDIDHFKSFNDHWAILPWLMSPASSAIPFGVWIFPVAMAARSLPLSCRIRACMQQSS